MQLFCNIQYEACKALPDHNQKMSDGIPVPTEFRGVNIWKSMGVNCREGGPWCSNLNAVISRNSSEKYRPSNRAKLCLGAPTQSFCNKWSTITSQVYHINSGISDSPESSKSIRSTPYGLRRELSWFFILMALLKFFARKDNVCSHIKDVFWLWVLSD
jgi:hypothetical protein